MKHRTILLATAMGLGALCAGAAQSGSPPQASPPSQGVQGDGVSAPQAGHHELADVKHVTGAHRFAGGKAEVAARDAAIERVVDQMNVLVRSIARRRLTEGNAIHKKIAIHRKGDVLTIVSDGRTLSAPIEGEGVTVKGSGGDDVTLYHRIYGNKIHQIFRGEEGERTNVITMTDEGFRMHVRVHSERLPEDVVYTLTYRTTK